MRAFLIAALASAALALPGVANAAPPANDAFATAGTVASLPYTDTVSMLEATTEPGEPQFCNFVTQSVWYAYTPSADGAVRADLAGTPTASALLTVHRLEGGGIGAMSFVGCTQAFGSITFRVQAGRTYYFRTAGLFGYVGEVRLNVAAIPPPANDDFANAVALGALPYSDSRDGTAATIEAGEPGGLEATAWYSFTAPETRSYVLAGSAPCGPGIVNAYTGDSMADLTKVSMSFAFRTFLSAVAGTTYRIQLGTGFASCPGALSLNVRVPMDVGMGFSSSPSDPSSYDTVQFFNNSFDPEGAGITSMRWEFGGGVTAEGCCPSHTFGADGDYPVRLDVETADGRAGSLTRTIQVRTHDVAIAKLSVPQSASAGQTRSISVGVVNTRYTEQVTVRLLKSLVGGGYQQVGALTQEVAVRGGGRSTPFAFSYTFTAADAELGKVTFKTIAELQGARDALPGDNEAVGLPTKVAR